MTRCAQIAAVAAVLIGLGGCGDDAAQERGAVPQDRPPGSPSVPPAERGSPTPEVEPEPEPEDLLSLLVPKGVPTESGGQPAEPDELAVVKRWLAALTQGDIEAAADTFADGTVVQNLQPPMRLADRAARIAFNEQFPCGAEIVDASSVKGYLVVSYRLTDRADSPCDGPGGRAAGTIKVAGGKMTEWYRLPDPPQPPEPPAGRVV